MKRWYGLLIVAGVLAAVPALAFSPESLAQVDHSVTFIELQERPDDFSGRDLLLGGTIIAIEKRRSGGMQLEVAQLPLNAANRPDSSFASQGRFLATVPDELDLREYRPGMRVAVLGTVKSGGRVTVEGEETIYPVLRVKEMELWPGGVVERRLLPREVVVYDRTPETVYFYEDRYPYYWPYTYWPFYPIWFGASFTFHDHPVRHYRPLHRDGSWSGRHDGIRHGGSHGGSSIPARPQRHRR